MRRGLQRAGGFALFIAVSNSPAITLELIRLLKESMPGVEIETVTLDEQIDHPLDAVLAQVDRDKKGPVMIVGLERSTPSSAKVRPVLYALNVSRPEWPKELPRPVVFWIPEYLLGLMAREAPDFLDWRSDTHFFLEQPVQDLTSLDSTIWRDGLDERMSEARRLSRIEELRARLASQPAYDDPVILSARSDWLRELGNHLALLGNLNAAEQAHRDDLELALRLRKDDRLAGTYGNIGGILARKGDLDEAERLFVEELAIQEKLGDSEGIAKTLYNLSQLNLDRGSLDEAEKLLDEALTIAERFGLQEEKAAIFSSMSRVAIARGDLEKANALAEAALVMHQRSGARLREAEVCDILGMIALTQGDLALGEEYLGKAMRSMAELGDQEGLADVYSSFGLLHQMRGEKAAARESWQLARELYSRVGVASRRISRVEAWLRRLEEGAPSQL